MTLEQTKAYEAMREAAMRFHMAKMEYRNAMRRYESMLYKTDRPALLRKQA